MPSRPAVVRNHAPVRVAAGAALAALVLCASACQVPTTALEQRTFFCDSVAVGDSCGTGADGAPMICYQASQLGARDFCADRCSEQQAGASGPGWRCVDSRARLRSCRPDDGPTACAQSDMQCLRTDGLRNEGLCMPVNTCSAHAECQDRNRTTCLGPLLQEFYGPHAQVRPDHWPCLQVGCKARQTSCGPGETCLPTVIPASSLPLDVCVPNCDLHLNCPPNYLCLKRVSGPAAPGVCLPGILGFRCENDIDCMLGDCVDGGDGFRLCATPCQADEECARLGSQRGPFMCARTGPGPERYCMNPRAYTGISCASDAQCRPHESCVPQSPYFGSLMETGECRARCAADQPCQDRGGIPHVCVQLGETRTCYPGRLQMPCSADDDCIGDLRCLEISVVDRQDGRSTVRGCSLPCAADADCEGNRFTEGAAFCSLGRCVARLHLGMRCQEDRECYTRLCRPSTAPGEMAPGIRRCQ